MKNICIVCETWSSGGIESFLNNVLTHMDITNLNIDIVVVNMKDSIFTDTLEKRGIRFFVLSGNRNRILKNRSIFLQFLKRKNYDVIHINMFHAGSLYFAKLAKEVGIPIRIVHSHNTALRKSFFSWFKILIHNIGKCFFSRYATHFFACSEMAAKFMFSSKVISEDGFNIIPNAIDLERFDFKQQIREKERLTNGLDNKFVLGCVGRLCSQKNQLFAIHVLDELLKINSEYVLVLVGDGPDRYVLEKEASDLGILEHVIFYGITDCVENLFFAMDILIMPSLFEGLGIVAIEAQATGLPVLCSDNIPKEAFITNFIFSLSLNLNSQKWANQLKRHRNMLYNRKNGRSLVKEAGFDIVDVSKQIEGIYNLK